jgi:hypothetical protein
MGVLRLKNGSLAPNKIKVHFIDGVYKYFGLYPDKEIVLSKSDAVKLIASRKPYDSNLITLDDQEVEVYLFQIK